MPLQVCKEAGAKKFLSKPSCLSPPFISTAVDLTQAHTHTHRNTDCLFFFPPQSPAPPPPSLSLSLFLSLSHARMHPHVFHFNCQILNFQAFFSELISVHQKWNNILIKMKEFLRTSTLDEASQCDPGILFVRKIFCLVSNFPLPLFLSLSLSFSLSLYIYILIPKTIGNRKRDCAWGGLG